MDDQRGTPVRSRTVRAWRQRTPARISHLALLVTIGLSVVVPAACAGTDSGSGASTTRQRGTPPSTTPKGGRTASTRSGPDPNAPEVVAPGDIPDNQAFVPYQSAGGFTVKVPEGWSRTDVASDHVRFSDKFNTVDLTWKPRATPPTEATVRTEIDSQVLPGFSINKVSTVQRPSGPVVVAAYGRTSDPNPVTGKRIVLDVEQYEFFHDGTGATVTLSGAKGSDNVDPWKTVTNSVGWNR